MKVRAGRLPGSPFRTWKENQRHFKTRSRSQREPFVWSQEVLIHTLQISFEGWNPLLPLKLSISSRYSKAACHTGKGCIHRCLAYWWTSLFWAAIWGDCGKYCYLAVDITPCVHSCLFLLGHFCLRQEIRFSITCIKQFRKYPLDTVCNKDRVFSQMNRRNYSEIWKHHCCDCNLLIGSFEISFKEVILKKCFLDPGFVSPSHLILNMKQVG